MHVATVSRVANIVFFSALALGANSGAMAQAPTPAAGGNGPDIRGIRTGMAPQQVYDLLKGIDPTNRVTVGQLKIPDLLGDKSAVYGMAPETFNGVGDEMIYVLFTLPPNPQQVWQVHRQLISSIHTTLDQTIGALRQKYGQEYAPPLGSNPTMIWVYDEQGRLAKGLRPETTLRDCTNSWMQPVATGNIPAGQITAGVLPIVIGNSTINSIPPLLDPTKNPPCHGLVMVRAVIGGDPNRGYGLEVTLSDYGLQNAAAYALKDSLSKVAAGQQQQELTKAKAQSVPAL
jgi:hypothetical protein